MIGDLLFKGHWFVFTGVILALSWAAAILAEGSVLAVAIAGSLSAAAAAVTVYRKHVSDNILMLRRSLWELTKPGTDAQAVIDKLKADIQWGMPGTIRNLNNRMVHALHRESTSTKPPLDPIEPQPPDRYELRFYNLSVFIPRAELAGVDLSDLDLCGAVLIEANLKGANLSGTDLRGAYLNGADLRDANLTKANLENAVLLGVKIDGANLQDARIPKPLGPKDAYDIEDIMWWTQRPYDYGPDQWPRPDWQSW